MESERLTATVVGIGVGLAIALVVLLCGGAHAAALW